MSRMVFTILLLAGTAAAGPAVHVDLRNGFSFPLPEGALARPHQGSGMLGKWVGLDEKSKAVVWALTFYRARPDDTGKANLTADDLPRYARTLQDRLTQETNLTVDSAKVVTAAGKPAIDVVGLFALDKDKPLQQFRRQVWVLTGPAEFFVVKIEGSPKDRARLTELCEAVLGGLSVLESRQVLQVKGECLQRGSALLTELATPAGTKRLHGLARTEVQWFLLSLEGKPVGFKAQLEGPVRHQGASGVQVSTWSMTQAPPAEPVVQTETYFLADGLQGESWQVRCRSGAGEKARVDGETGTVGAGGRLSCQIARGARTATLQRDMPVEVIVGSDRIRNIYLPRAAGELLPRLVDRSRPGAYAFAVYNGQADRIDLRIFRVFEPETITVGGVSLRAAAAADYASDEAPPVRLWLDENGLIVRLAAPGGLTMERSTRAAVFQAFPQAEQVVRETPGKN